MAQITLDVGELPDRSPEIPGWLDAGDTVVLTVGGRPAFRLVPVADRVDLPPQPLPPRVLGMHAGSAVMAPDFNDPLPEDWSDGPV